MKCQTYNQQFRYLQIKNNKWINDFDPIDENSDIFVDKIYSKAYLRHLFNVNEILAKQIASIHNLAFYVNLMKKAREKIILGAFASWKNELVKKLGKRL